MTKRERQEIILEPLSLRRHDKICNIAFELNVNEKNIRRDLKELSKVYPIVVERGVMYGGVYVANEFQYKAKYLTNAQINLLQSLLVNITKEDRETIEKLLSKYIGYIPKTLPC